MVAKYSSSKNSRQKRQWVLIPLIGACLWVTLLFARVSLHRGTLSQLVHVTTAATTSAVAGAAEGGWPLQHAPRPTRAYTFAPGAPFKASEYSSLLDMLWGHKAWQEQALSDAAAKHPEVMRKQQPWPPVLRVDLQHTVGVGNRWPCLVTGLLMAALTSRVFMVSPEQRFEEYMSLTVDADWGKHSALYGDISKLPTCEAFFNSFLRPDVDLCKEGEPRNATLMWYSSSDYDVPLLQINPSLRELLARLLPSGEFFHETVKFLFRPSEAVYAALQPYKALSEGCAVGVHLRSLKPVKGGPKSYLNLQQFARVATGLAGTRPGNIFVASDSDNFREMAALLPGRQVWWNHETQDSLVQGVGAAGNNPGSDLSALVDIMLLSRCKHIVLTAGSSFATMAAGLGNIKAVHVVRGEHETPFYNPWFWASISSEPCMWKAGRILSSWMSGEVREALRREFYAFLYHEQCN